jgi:hypothetical protein
MLYPTLWQYQNMINTSTNFSRFHLVRGNDSILPIECEIHSLKLAIDLLHDTIDIREYLIHLEKLDEKVRHASMAIEVNKICVKV